MDRRCCNRVDALNRRTATALTHAWQVVAGRLTAILLAFMAALAPCAAAAHDGAPTSFASITVVDKRVLYSLTTSSQPLEQASSAAKTQFDSGADALAPVRMASLLARHLRIEADGRRCLPGAADYVPPSPPRLSTTYNIEFRCEAPIRTLRVADDSFDLIGRGAHTLLRVSIEGREEPLASAVMLSDENRSAEFDLGQLARGSAEAATGSSHLATGADLAGGTLRGPIGLLPLGFEHILEGWDHLLFLLALALPGGCLGAFVRIVTSFTIAHSLTLAVAALGLVNVPAAPVEALIALSIAWVAAENLMRVRPMERRWAVAFAFGLIHGFGFATGLRDIGLPRDALLPSLIWFNLGIEFGQLLVLLLLVPVLTWLSRALPEKPVSQALSALILVASAMLLLQRV